MKKIAIAAALIASSVSALNAETTVVWETLGNFARNGKAYHIQRFTITPDQPLSRIAYNHNGNFKNRVLNATDTFLTIIPTYYAIASPRLAEGKPVIIDVETSSQLYIKADTPSGMHAVDMNGNPVKVKYIRKPLTDRKEQWSLGSPQKEGKTIDYMPAADRLYAENAELLKGKTPSAYDIIPSFKSVKQESQTVKVLKETEKKIKHSNPEFVRIIVGRDGTVTYEYASKQGLIAARNAFREKVIQPNGGVLPVAVIEDYPDFNYRGLMIDVSRNWHSLDRVKKMVKEAALHRINKFQFHFIDDDGWRLEIPGLPELTELGSRRGYSLDDKEFLAQTFNGNGDPNDTTTTANGYITRREFIEFLKWCKSIGVDVIPEIESPGHARAAVYAMEKRYRDSGDSSYRLREDGDTSVYETAQCYTDNLMNPALPSTYRFMYKVIDEVVKMYKEAGVPLEAIHIGGDEVPHNGWLGSPSVQKLMKEKGFDKESQVHAYFVENISNYLHKKGLKMNGWQEIAINNSDQFNRTVAPRVGGVNAWSTLQPRQKKALAEALRNGFPIILSNVERYYLDLVYNYHPEETGLTWGGAVDELRSLGGYPDELLEVAPDAKGKVVGIQGQLWGETLHDTDKAEYMLFPKLLGLAERGWNKGRTYSDSDFVTLINAKERPRWEAAGMTYRLRQPGIVVENGKVMMNASSPDLEIRYTLDGTDPTPTSPRYVSPFTIAGTPEIRARVFTPDGRHSSLPTIR